MWRKRCVGRRNQNWHLRVIDWHWWDGSAGKGAGLQAWRPEVNLQNLPGRRREPTPAGSSASTHMLRPVLVIPKNSVFGCVNLSVIGTFLLVLNFIQGQDVFIWIFFSLLGAEGLCPWLPILNVQKNVLCETPPPCPTSVLRFSIRGNRNLTDLLMAPDRYGLWIPLSQYMFFLVLLFLMCCAYLPSNFILRKSCSVFLVFHSLFK